MRTLDGIAFGLWSANAFHFCYQQRYEAGGVCIVLACISGLKLLFANYKD